MLISIHQPDYLPWVAYFDKIARADAFVLLDTADYSRNGFHNRNKIKTGAGAWSYLTVPVPRAEIFKPLAQVALPSGKWADEHWKTIENHYRRAPHWKEYAPAFAELYKNAAAYETLAALNAELIRRMCAAFGIKTRIVMASELQVRGNGSSQIVALCKALDAERYLSGPSGKEYLDVGAFEKEGVQVEFQEFREKERHQLFPPFVAGLSAIDLLLNEGAESAAYL